MAATATATAAAAAAASAAASSSSSSTISKVTIPSDFRTLPTPTAFVPAHPPALAYTQSSQFQNWRFSRAQLAALRKSANGAARRRVAEAWGDDGGSGGGGGGGGLPFPNEQDELELIRFYLGKVPALTRALSLPDFAGAAAMSYMKRFYLRNSCLEWHPKHI
ncbi:hypothetical protein OC844_007701, partial [Tilletia horrida]